MWAETVGISYKMKGKGAKRKKKKAILEKTQYLT